MSINDFNCYAITSLISNEHRVMVVSLSCTKQFVYSLMLKCNAIVLAWCLILCVCSGVLYRARDHFKLFSIYKVAPVHIVCDQWRWLCFWCAIHSIDMGMNVALVFVRGRCLLPFALLMVFPLWLVSLWRLLLSHSSCLGFSLHFTQVDHLEMSFVFVFLVVKINHSSLEWLIPCLADLRGFTLFKFTYGIFV